MTWYWKLRGAHVHVTVYLNGALCGNLVFTDSEFEQLVNGFSGGGFMLFSPPELPYFAAGIHFINSDPTAQ